MPKSAQSSPPLSHSHPRAGSEDASPRMSDVALRKKKNADAQAAFRARRANYISTLEETVTSLESVVLQLQESCREARTQATVLRQDNARLRLEFREREKFWKALWQARKTGQAPECEEQLPSSPTFPSMHPHLAGMNTHLGPSHMNEYGVDGLYRSGDDQSAAICNGHYSNAGHYTNHSPSMPFAVVEHEQVPGDGSSQALNPHRVPKYATYPYSIHGSNRDAAWPQSIGQGASSGGESGPPTSTNSASHSPGFVESPTLTPAEMSFVNRFPVEEQKVPMGSLDATPYVFPNSRSLSPTSTPPSSSSTSLTSPFQFAFPENSMSHDRPDFDYRRQANHPHGPPEVTLHGGTADISIAGLGSDAVRLRLGSRRANSGPERPLLSVLPPLSESENSSQNERGSSEGEPTMFSHNRLRPRRSTAPSRTSRSPSPGHSSGPPISGTLAVIKAQAFGALRRTRARTKKSSDGAAKVAMDVLEARGIEMGVATGSKRPRLQIDDEGDTEMPR